MNQRCTFKDGQNSVRRVVDTTGSVVASYDYDAWGNVLGQDQPPGWIFNHRAFGEIQDPNLGMTYLRARWMDPGTGRFGSRDGFGGQPRSPSTMHRYLFAADDPVNKRDPSGFLTLGQIWDAINFLDDMGDAFGLGRDVTTRTIASGSGSALSRTEEAEILRLANLLESAGLKEAGKFLNRYQNVGATFLKESFSGYARSVDSSAPEIPIPYAPPGAPGIPFGFDKYFVFLTESFFNLKSDAAKMAVLYAQFARKSSPKGTAHLAQAFGVRGTLGLSESNLPPVLYQWDVFRTMACGAYDRGQQSPGDLEGIATTIDQARLSGYQSTFPDDGWSKWDLVFQMQYEEKTHRCEGESWF